MACIFSPVSFLHINEAKIDLKPTNTLAYIGTLFSKKKVFKVLTPVVNVKNFFFTDERVK